MRSQYLIQHVFSHSDDKVGCLGIDVEEIAMPRQHDSQAFDITKQHDLEQGKGPSTMFGLPGNGGSVVLIALARLARMVIFEPLLTLNLFLSGGTLLPET